MRDRGIGSSEAAADGNLHRSRAEQGAGSLRDVRATDGEAEPADNKSVEQRVGPQADDRFRRAVLDGTRNVPGRPAEHAKLRAHIPAAEHDARGQEARCMYSTSHSLFKHIHTNLFEPVQFLSVLS